MPFSKGIFLLSLENISLLIFILTENQPLSEFIKSKKQTHFQKIRCSTVNFLHTLTVNIAKKRQKNLLSTLLILTIWELLTFVDFVREFKVNLKPQKNLHQVTYL